jgi:hypothetical protein
MTRATGVTCDKLNLEETLLPKLQAAGINTAFDLLNATPEDLARIGELAAEAVEPLRQQVRDAVWRTGDTRIGDPKLVAVAPPPRRATLL